MTLNRNLMTRNRLSRTQMIPILSRSNLTRSRLIPIPMNLIRNRLNLIPMNRTRNPEPDPDEPDPDPADAAPRIHNTPPNKRTDKRKKGLRAPKEIVNEGASSTPLLNRPALTPIVRGGKLACV